MGAPTNSPLAPLASLLGVDSGLLATVLIAAVVFGAMGLVVWGMWKRRRAGECASGCSGCPSAGACSAYVPPLEDERGEDSGGNR